jgi:hypothetical protein
VDTVRGAMETPGFAQCECKLDQYRALWMVATWMRMTDAKLLSSNDPISFRLMLNRFGEGDALPTCDRTGDHDLVAARRAEISKHLRAVIGGRR